MTDNAMSPLRRRMIEDMTIRKLAPKTQYDYVQRIKNFAAFLGRSPDAATFDDARRYQLHLAASGGVGGCARLLQIPNHGVQQREINNARDANGDGDFEISGQCCFMRHGDFEISGQRCFLCHFEILRTQVSLVRFGPPDCEPVHT
jgi:hypothetical protein